jgi:thermostable 8-oxoguanine DNA glycosylase
MLRNCGRASNAAILDVHLLRALVEADVVRDITLPRDYLAVEDAYLRWAEELRACPAALDLFLWDVQRTLRTSAPPAAAT